jgi:hypothetical protein
MVMVRAYVPRQLRVRSSIQLASTRVPARTFLIVAGLIFLGGLMVVAGADLVQTVKVVGGLIIIALLIFELRCWGRSTREVARIVMRHYRRAWQLRLDRRMVPIPIETATTAALRRPRWQAES